MSSSSAPPHLYSVILVLFRYHRAVLLKMSMYWYKGLEPEYISVYCFLHQRNLVSRKMSAELNSVLRDINDWHSGLNFLPHWRLVAVCRLTASLWTILSITAVQYLCVTIKLDHCIANPIVSSFFIIIIAIGPLIVGDHHWLEWLKYKCCSCVNRSPWDED